MITQEQMQAVANQRALEAIGYKFYFGLKGWSVSYGDDVIDVYVPKRRNKTITQDTLMKYRLLAVPLAIADKQRRGL